MCVCAIDIDLLQQSEADAVLGTNTRLDLIGILWLLRHELVARKCQYLKTTLVEFRMKLLELIIPAHSLASEAGNVDHEADLPMESIKWESATFGVIAFQVKEIGGQLAHGPICCVF